MSDAAITVHNLYRFFGPLQAVNGVSFEIPHGSVCGFVGANGAGKTNFIRFFELLANMMDPNKGLQNYIASRGRADAFLFRGMKVTPELRAHLWFGLNEYKFTLRGAADRSLFFAQEAAPFNGPIHGPAENICSTFNTWGCSSQKFISTGISVIQTVYANP